VSRRRRSLVLLGLALVLGGLAASDVASREAALERRVGALTPVVVARHALPAHEPLEPSDLTVRSVPARFAPRGGFTDPRQLAGQEPATAVPAGADVTAVALKDPAAGPAGAPVRTGERVAELVATAPRELVVAGARVDVLVTREARPGTPGRTTLALEDVEVLEASPAAAGERESGKVRAALRVTLRQAVYLAAAQSFARELRLLPRAAHDRRRRGSALHYGEDVG
jgi:pilus assembly protein CpaB